MSSRASATGPRGGERAERGDAPLRIDQTCHASCKFVGNIEPLREPVHPICGVGREPLRCGRPPQRGSKHVVSLHHRPNIRRSDAGRAQRRDDPLARELELAANWRPRLRRANERAGEFLEIAVRVEKSPGEAVDESLRGKATTK